MKQKKAPMPRIQFVVQPSRPMTKVVALVAVVFSAVALLTLRGAIIQAQEQTDALRREAAVLAEQNQALEDKIDKVGTVDGTRQIAQEELGLVDPDVVIFE